MGAAVGSSGGSLLELLPLPLSAVAIGMTVGIVNVFLFFPLLMRFLPGLRYWGPIHHRPISDIPVRCCISSEMKFGGESNGF